MKDMNAVGKERIDFVNSLSEDEIERRVEALSIKLRTMSAEERAALNRKAFEDEDREKGYRKKFRDQKIIQKVKVAKGHKNTIFEELFSLRGGLELLGKDQRTTRELQTIAVNLMQEFGREVGYHGWVVKVKGRYYVDTVGKEFLRQVFMELDNPTTTSFERKMKIALHNFKWNRYIDSSLTLSSSELLQDCFDKDKSGSTPHLIDELRALVVVAFGHGHFEILPFSFTERLLRNSRNVFTYSGSNTILLSDNGFARVDYENDMFWDWCSHFSISVVEWTDNQFRRIDTEIFQISAFEFAYAADYIEKEMAQEEE